ncbi:MAG: hypothetical protein J0L63_07605 [Anaerolineae bacterium]|nr:hypothetical protein [Anaerolineae bacterium]
MSPSICHFQAQNPPMPIHTVILAAAVSLTPAFGGIGGTAAANTGFPAAKSDKHPPSRRQPTKPRAKQASSRRQ